MTMHLGTPERLPTVELNTYHRNPRRGDVSAIASSLRANGQYRPIVVNRGTHTSRPMEVLAGNHTLMAALSLDGSAHEITELDAYVVDVTEDAAARIVLADNRTADLGEYDESVLTELLEGVDDLDGSGYTEEDLEDLLAELEEDYPEPGSAPLRDTSAPSSANSPGDEEGETEGGAPQPEGTRATNSHVTAAPGYANQPTRMIILHLPLERFIWAQRQLEAYAEAHAELDGSNSNSVIKLLEAWSGENAPEDTEEGDE